MRRRNAAFKKNTYMPVSHFFTFSAGNSGKDTFFPNNFQIGRSAVRCDGRHSIQSVVLLSVHHILKAPEIAATSVSRALGGAGGNRTLVQTGKSYAFYMLIPAFGFRVQARPGPPTRTLSSIGSSAPRGRSGLSPI